MPGTADTSGSPFDGGEIETLQFQVDGLTESQNRLNLSLQSSDRIGRQFARTLGSAFIGLAVQGKSFGAVLSSLAISLSNIALRAAFKPLEAAFGNAFQSLISAPPVFSGASIAAPSGFPVAAGVPISGAMSSASSVAAVASPSSLVTAAPSIVLNVTTPDAESFRSSETQIAALLARAVGQGQRNL